MLEKVKTIPLKQTAWKAMGNENPKKFIGVAKALLSTCLVENVFRSSMNMFYVSVPSANMQTFNHT